MAPDHFGAGLAATQYLIAEGCRRIAYLGESDGAGTAERFMGYLTALNAAGLPVDQALVAGTIDAVPDGCDGLFIAGAAPKGRLDRVGRVVRGAVDLSFDGDLAGRRLLASLLCRKDSRAVLEKVPFSLRFVE